MRASPSRALTILVSCLAAASVTFAARGFVVTPSGLSVSQEWYWAVLGTGGSGMAAVDLEGDGTTELVVAGDTCWYVLEWQGNGYAQLFASLPFEQSIHRLIVAQVDSDPQQEILIGLSNRLLVYDGLGFGLERDLTTQAPTSVELAAGDLDSDPAIEVAICEYHDPWSANQTWVYDLGSGSLEIPLTGYPCSDVAIGETDGTPGRELVVANGSEPGVVLDGETGSVEWSHPLGFGNLVALGDLDGDLRDEIVAAFTWNAIIQVWHVESHSFYWEAPTTYSLGAVAVDDIDRNGSLEVLYGYSQGGAEVHALEGTSGSELWEIPAPEYGVARIAVGDLDGDAVAEVVVSTGSDEHLYVYDGETQALEWRNESYQGPFLGLAHGDVDADGAPELVFTTSHSEHGYGDGLYLVYGAVTKELKYQSPPPTGNAYVAPSDLEVADLDSDAALELLLPTSDAYSGILQCWDGLTHQIEWDRPAPWSEAYYAVETADPDADGALEVVATEGSYVLILSAAGALEWQSFSVQSFFEGPLSNLRVTDVDGDGAGEVVIAGNSRLMVIDPLLQTIELAELDLEVTALDTADVDFDGVEEIVIGTAGGFIRRVDAATGEATTIAGPFGAVTSLAIGEVTGDNVPDYAFTASRRVRLVNGAGAQVEWVSEDLGYGVGGGLDSVLVGDVDEDGTPEIWVNAGSIGHLLFAVAQPLFADGFESGTTGAWWLAVP